MPMIKNSAEQNVYIALSHNIKKRMALLQVTDKQVAMYAGMNPSTFIQKRNHPERFKYAELIRVFKRLHFSDDELLESVKIGGE